MAKPDVTRKLRIYHTMFRLNLSFTNSIVHCRTLAELGVLSPKFMKLYQSYAQELQAEINGEVTGILESVESDDMFRFGKARTAREKELRDPDDVFIEAEERRRELARQGKTPPSPQARRDLNERSQAIRAASGSLQRRLQEQHRLTTPLFTRTEHSSLHRFAQRHPQYPGEISHIGPPLAESSTKRRAGTNS